MHKTKKRNALAKLKQFPGLPLPPAQSDQSLTQFTTKSMIKHALDQLKIPLNRTHRKISSLQRKIDDYARQNTLQNSSQTFNEILTSIKEEYQTETDIQRLIESIPITSTQYEEVKQRCHTDYLKHLLGHLKFLMDLKERTDKLGERIETALISKELNIALANIGEYENSLYANEKKVEIYNNIIQRLVGENIQSQEGILLNREINDLIKKKDVDTIQRLQILKQDKVYRLQVESEKQHFNLAIDYLILTCQEIIDSNAASSEIDILMKKLKTYILPNRTAKKDILAHGEIIKNHIATFQLKDVIYQAIDELERRIRAYESMPGPKDPIVLHSIITYQQSLRKNALLSEKLKAFTDYIKAKKNLERQDLINLEIMYEDCKQFSSGFTIHSIQAEDMRVRKDILEMIRNELNFQQEILLQEDDLRTSQSNSTSNHILPYANKTIQLMQQTLQPGEMIREKLVNQPIGDDIPIIVINMHGTVLYDEQFRCLPFRLYFDVLYRFISAAPYEDNTEDREHPKSYDLLKNTVIKNKTKTIKEVLEEAQTRLFTTKSLDVMKYITTIDNEYTFTTDPNKRNHLIINYKGSNMCHKILELDKNPKYNTKMGIFVVNKTTVFQKAGINMIHLKEFVDYLKTFNDNQSIFETNKRKEFVRRFNSRFLYKFLKEKGFKEVVVIDASCESATHFNERNMLSTTIIFGNNKDPEILKEVENLKNLNFAKDGGKILANLYHQKFRRTNPDYKLNYENTIRAQILAKRKSRKHLFSVVNNQGKTR